LENKLTKTILMILGLGLIIGTTFLGGLLIGIQVPDSVNLPSISDLLSNPQTTEPTLSPGETIDRETLFEPFWQVWDMVLTQYVDQPVDQVKLMRGAISGMLASLGDEHTGYMDPFEFEQANAPLEGSYEGIGAYVDTSGEFLTIISPMEGSPAEAAGLQSGDKIIAVDGEDATGTDPSLVLRKVLGQAGTTVILTIRREEVAEPFDVSIVRGQIVIPTVTSEMLDDQIAYVRISSYSIDTDRDLEDQLRALIRENPVGLILDLRDNPGGYLDTAINVLSQFIPDGVVMIEEYGNGEQITFESRKGGLATEIPMVVLINQGSASSSEITAGAIQDRGRGLLVGMKSYGKGSVQSWTELVNDQGAVKITIARWLTPNGTQLAGQGLTPDFIVDLTEDDFNNDRDPQLDKAIEVLLNQVQANN
jgi:carboxyl-terminal processing protease